MSLLKRIEGATLAPPAPAYPVAPPPAPVPPPPVGGGAGTPVAPPPPAHAPAAPTANPFGGGAGQPPRGQAPGANNQAVEAQRGLKQRVKMKLVSELDPTMDTSKSDEVRQKLKSLFDQIIDQENMVLTKLEKERLFEELAADVIGFGPIEPLLQDPTVSEVMINGPKKIFVERKGKVVLSEVQFDDDEHVRRIIDRIVSPLGRHVDESSPICDARLPDGSRVNIVIPPISLVGPAVTIRKFSKEKLKVDDLIRFGSMTPEIAEFLKACVVARLNIVISGGTGSGKTTLLNVISNFIPDDERIISIEDSAELQISKEHWIRMETRPPNVEGTGAITATDCVKATLRMRPERVIIGECRGKEALDMLQAMNTGHDGSLTTGHANTPRDMLARLETMVLMAGMDLPVRAIREQISSAVDMVIQQSRMRDGSRKITYITEVQGMEGEKVTLQDIFTFEQEAFENGKVIGKIKPTGVRPKFMPKIEDAGIVIPPSVFGISGGFF
ncbi:MAG: CpaF family protein [Chloroflexi bacterium]|nr:CpaF family protein [Chloroflexota bacterium]